MNDRKFFGYVRENGSVGIRNYVLVMSVTHASHILTAKIGENVNGVKAFTPEDEDGRTSGDRAVISRTLIGLGANPNVDSVLLTANSRAVSYNELGCDFIASEIRKSGKRVEAVVVDECGGFYNAVGIGVKIARELSLDASARMREEADIGRLCVGVKCGLSDATSGIAGNPVVGYLGDIITGRGGTFIFSETTEVIGAEHILAKRCVSEAVRERFLDAVYSLEAEAKGTGEDIRTINPIPANIEAGITTLEEKSLGAVIKAGTSPLCGVVGYGEKPAGSGLYFMDSWMSSTALFLGYAACGCVLSIFQMGGNALPAEPPMPAVATGIVMPLMYVTGNFRTFEKAKSDIDFNAGRIISEGLGIDAAGEQLCGHVCRIASGMSTKAETLSYQDRVEMYLKGPAL